jgi:hypothetical protein
MPNQINNETSPLLNLHEQLIYKIAQLDASMQMGFRRLDEKMDRFQNDLHENQIETNNRMNKLENEVALHVNTRNLLIEAVEGRVGKLETWQAVATAKVSVALAVVIVAWAAFGTAVQNFLARIFN